MNNPLNYTDPSGYDPGDISLPPFPDPDTIAYTTNPSLGNFFIYTYTTSNDWTSNITLNLSSTNSITPNLDTSSFGNPFDGIGGVSGGPGGGSSYTTSSGGPLLSSISSGSGGLFAGAIAYYTSRSQTNFAAGNNLAGVVDKVGVIAMEYGLPHSFASVPLMFIGGTELSQLHHIASDKAISSGFTEAYRLIFSKAGMTLNDPLNKILWVSALHDV